MNIPGKTLKDFVKESNRIEEIIRAPLSLEIVSLSELLETPRNLLCYQNVLDFVGVLEPTAQVRQYSGMNVRVGDYVPPRGGPLILADFSLHISQIADSSESPYRLHQKYERLHPFTDCNGRSGRALWLWQMYHHYNYDGELLFLHKWYYQSLQENRP